MNDKTTIDLLRILLVEDNPTDALLIKIALEQVRGVKITLTLVKRLDEALLRLQAEYFDAVLLDLGLPDSSGLETFTRTQSSYPNVPILILSGLDDETLALTAVRDGAQDYLVKGKINSIMLARTIRYAVERKRTVEKLAASEMSYRRLFETAQDGIFLLNADTGQITDANPFLENLLGYSTAEFVGKRLWEVGAFRDKAANEAAFQTLQEKRYIRYEDLPLSTKDGRLISVEFTSNVHGAGGKQVIQCNIRDIGERKRAEAAEQEAKLFLHSTLNSLSSHIAVLDAEGMIIAVNHAWESFADENGGSPAACSVGANYLEACDQAKGEWRDGAAAAARGIREVIAGERPISRLEYSCHSPNEQRWFNLRVTRFDDAAPLRVVVAHENITDRKLAENLIVISEANLAKSQEMARLGSWELDLSNLADINANPLRWSDEIYRIMGHEPGEFEPSNEAFFRAVHPDDREKLSSMMAEAIQGGKPYSIDHRIIWPDGTEHIIHAQSELIYSEDTGLPLKMVGLGQDITERKQSEQELQETNEKFQLLVNNIADTFWIRSPDMVAQYYLSPSFKRMWGIPVETQYSAPHIWSEFIVPEDRERVKAAFAELMQDTPSISVEYRIQQHGGEVRWVHSRGYQVRNDAGELIRLAGIVSDITERKQAEEALRASEERFQNIVANVPGVVYQYALHPDGSTEIPFVNDGCRELLEMEPEEIQRSPNFLTDIIHPDDRAESERPIAESALNLTPWNWEGRFQLPSGEIKWVQGISQPHRLPNGGTLWDGLLLDVTARKEAESERDRFFTMSLDMLCIADHNGYFKRLNPAFEATLGHSDAELMAKPFMEWVHPDDRDATLEVMKELDAGASSSEFVNRYCCSDGSYRWLSWVSAPFEGLVYAAGHDVTSLKNAEAALHKANDELELHVIERTSELSHANGQLQSEMLERRRADEALYKNHEFLQAVLESTADGIVACDAAGELTFFNRATREFHGLPLESLPAKQWSQHYSLYLSDGITPMQRDEVPLFRALDGERIFDVEMVIAPGTGDTRLVTNSGGPLFDANGAKLGAVVVMHDITQSRRAEVELRRAKEDAEAANLAKSEFLSRMSHELRTPLNAILGFGQLLEMRNQDIAPQQQDNIQQILKAGRHLLDLINEVLDIARIEAGHLSLSIEPVAVGRSVREALDVLRPLAAARQIHLVYEVLEGCEEQHIMADQQRFKQVLINLLSNAVKYNRDGGSVSVSCHVQGESADSDTNYLRVSVHDTGPGLTPAEITRLFIPFERLGAAHTQTEGTGIGLSLCKRLVEAMNGRVGVESEVGRGSSFWLELPLVESSPEVDALTSGSSASTSTSPSAPDLDSACTILCIEDNLSNLELVKQVLNDLSGTIRFLSAMQGSIGLDMANSHHPDLILLDVNLPDIMGDVVLSRLKANPVTQEIPVIVLSADATPRQIDRLLNAGAAHYLTKPLDIELFLSILKETLETTNSRKGVNA